MHPLDNTGWLNISGNCECSGFVPSISYSFNSGTNVMTVTDASTFPAADGLSIVHVYVTDQFGNQVYGKIQAAAGNVAISTATLNKLEGVNVRATVITTKRCTANLTVFNIAAYAANAGSLGNSNKGSEL